MMRPRTRIRRQGLIGSLNLKRRRWLKSWSFTLSVFFVFALFCVWSRVKVIETGYRLRHLEEEAERLGAVNHALNLEAAMLRSPRRLGQVAREMGLKRPREEQVFVLRGAE